MRFLFKVFRIFSLVLAISLVFYPSICSGFLDLSPDHWAGEIIENLSALGILSGYPDGTFRPENSITRAGLAKIAALAFEIPTASPSASRFQDVSGDFWGALFIEACASAGLIRGYPDGTFRPEERVSREVAVTIIVRWALREPILSQRPQVFTDVPPQRWSFPYVQSAVELGLFKPDDPHFSQDGLFQPELEASRAQVCFLLYNMLFFSQCLWIGEPEEYQVNYTVHLKNLGEGEVSRLELTVPVIKDFPPYQFVSFSQITPSPDRLEDDEQGNTFAFFQKNNLQVGESASFSLIFKVEIFPFVYQPPPSLFELSYDPNNPIFVRYTSPERFEESDSSQIKEKAEELSSGKSLFEAARELYRFVGQYLTYGGYRPEDKGALQVYLAGEGDCTEFADLFVALTRASQIPARFVEGFTYNEHAQGRGDLTHDWAEIMLMGGIWLPVDPTFGRFGENFFCASDNRHITLTRGRNLKLLGGYHYYYYRYWFQGAEPEIQSWDEISIDHSPGP